MNAPDNKASVTKSSVDTVGCLLIWAGCFLPLGAWIQWGIGMALITLGTVCLIGAVLARLR